MCCCPLANIGRCLDTYYSHFMILEMWSHLIMRKYFTAYLIPTSLWFLDRFRFISISFGTFLKTFQFKSILWQCRKRKIIGILAAFCLDFLGVSLPSWSQVTASFAAPAIQKCFPIALCLIDSPSVLLWTSFWWPMFASGVNMLLFKVFLLCHLPFQGMIYCNRGCVLCAGEREEIQTWPWGFLRPRLSGIGNHEAMWCQEPWLINLSPQIMG